MDVEEGRKIMNWAIFELLLEKDTENDNQNGERQVSEIDR